MTEGLGKGQELLASGDVAGLLRYLRGEGETLPLGEAAALTAGAARLAGFGDLEKAASAVADGPDAGPDYPVALYWFGFACLERGAARLAIRPLTRALELVPDAAPLLSELVAALEQDGQHARAVSVLEARGLPLDWQSGFQYVYNAIMAGSLDKAAAGFRRLPEPADAAWRPAREKVRRMLVRADVAGAVTPLDVADLRGWHYVLTGGVLATLSPYGFDPMTGRWAYVCDSLASCATALRRLKLILEAAGAVPASVLPLPDRSSQIVGTAAAALLGLPVRSFDPGSPAPDSLVVAYDLKAADPAAVAALRDRVPGQVLFERATCWTSPPRVTADISGLLGQTVIAPWEPQLRRLEDGTIGDGPGDERPAGAVADELAGLESQADEGDGSAPADPDSGLRCFVEAVTGAGDGGWLGGLREYVPDAGPVPSTRFL